MSSNFLRETPFLLFLATFPNQTLSSWTLLSYKAIKNQFLPKHNKGLVSNSLHGWSFTRGWSSKHKLKSGTYQIYHTLEGAVGSPYILSFIHNNGLYWEILFLHSFFSELHRIYHKIRKPIGQCHIFCKFGCTTSSNEQPEIPAADWISCYHLAIHVGNRKGHWSHISR